MARRPVVLVTPDLDERSTHRGVLGYLQLQRYYTDRILAEGGVPLVPPPVQQVDDAVAVAHQLVALADALVISGGGHDVDPALYGEERLPACGAPNAERTDFELLLLRAAEARDLPVLGICGGLQLLNVARGGSLFQDLPTQRPGPVEHTMQGAKTRTCHAVVVHPGTRLAAIVGAGRVGVNSTHHQAIKAVGRGLVVSAHADDGLIEAVEDPDRAFCIGVQWHPEAVDEPAHRAIYRELCSAARRRFGDTG
jgi:putative glutamine amidotransferase